MYKVTREQNARLVNACYVAFQIADKGFTVYTDMYEHTVQVTVHCDSINEVWLLIKAMKGKEVCYKKRIIKPKRTDDGQRWYVISYKFL